MVMKTGLCEQDFDITKMNKAQQGFSHGTVCPDLGSIPVSSHKNNLSLTEQHHIDFLTKKFQYCKQPDPTFGNNRIYFYP